MKNSLVPIAGISIVVAVFLIFNSTQTVKNIRQTLDLERYQRMTAEEKLQQAESRVRILQSQVDDSENKFDHIRSVLEEKETVADSMASQIDNIGQEKTALEARLKELESIKAQQSDANVNQ